MSYTPEQFMQDNGITREEVDEAKGKLLEEARLYRLKEARKARNMTQKQLAKTLGVSQKRVSVLETGDIARVKVDTLKRYLAGIGGTLHVTASMPDGRDITLV